MGMYTQLVTDIIANVGGKSNINDLRHCVTRLRFHLKDEKKANDEVLKNMDGVVGVVKAAGEYMVVIGEHVGDVYKEVCKQLGIDETGVVEKKKEDEEKKSFLDKALGIIMCGMGPTLNLLCACGIIKGLNVILSMAGIAQDSGVYQLLNAAGDSIFYFLPLIMGYNVAKKMEIDPYFGLILAGALCYPAIQEVDLNFFGYVVNAKYTSSFLPIIFGLLVAVPLYKFFDKHIHHLLKPFMTPLLTLLIAFPLTFIVFGPLANLLGQGINFVINFIFNISPIIGAIVLAGAWQILVMFGIHGLVVMFAFMDLMQGNPSMLLASTYAICFAVCGTLLAVLLKTKDEKLKSASGSAFVSAFLGVTEPAMYGIIIPRKKIFAATCLGGAASGLVVGLFGLKMYTYSGMGIIGALGLLNPEGPNIIGIALDIIVPFVVSFVLTSMVYKDDDTTNVKNTDKKEVENKKVAETITIKMPIKGEIKNLSQSSDEAFASEALGKGCLIVPTDEKVYAPVNGTVRTLFPTNHAIGVVSENGVEVLIHIGINTVNLQGKYFKAHVKQGDKVNAGQLLIEFDKKAIEKEGYNCEIPMIITNSKDYLDVVELDNKKHNVGDDALKIIL